MYRTITALILSVVLLIQPSALYAQPIPKKPQASHDAEESKPCFEIVHTSQSTGKRDLIVIIDAHNNLSAQYNISSIIDRYSVLDTLHAVYLEGASGALDPARLAMFNDPLINRITADILLHNRFITGAEYYGITAAHRLSFKGAELPEVYEANLNRFLELKTLSEKLHIEQLIDIFNGMIRSKEPTRFAALDELYTTVLTTGENLIPFVNTLHDYYYFDPDEIHDRFPLLANLVYLIKKSSHAQNVTQKLLTQLAKFLSDADEPDDLNEAKHLLLQTHSPDYYHRACILFDRYSPQLTPALIHEVKKYSEALTALDAASSHDIYMDIMRAYRAFYCDLEGTALFDARDALLGLLKGSRLNLTPEEVGYFHINSFNAGNYLEWLARLDSMNPATLTNWADELEQIHSLSRMIDRFYDAAEQRNNSIFSTINADLPPHKSAVLVVGGYHRDIFEIFEKNGFNLTVIRPNIDLQHDITPDMDYLDQLYGKFSSIEKMIYYSWSPIVHRLISQQADGFPSKLAASKVFTAEYIALMAGAAAQVHLNESAGTSKNTILARIKHRFTQFFHSQEQRARIAHYLQLPGTELAPRTMDIVDYQHIADGTGFIATFQIGNELMAVQWVPHGAVLSEAEQHLVSDIPGYKPKNSVTIQGNTFEISFAYIPVQQAMLKALRASLTKTSAAAMMVAGLMIHPALLQPASFPSGGVEYDQAQIAALTEYEQQRAEERQEQHRIAIQQATADPAIQTILQQQQPVDTVQIVSNADITIFTEYHPVLAIARLINESLEQMKQQGVTQLALELNSNFQPLVNRWSHADRENTLRALKRGMDRKMGKGVAENIVALIDEAKRLDMRVVAYDVPDRSLYGGTQSIEVEYEWYKTLQQNIDTYGGKMVALMGEGHIPKSRRYEHPFFYDGEHSVSVVYITGGQMLPVADRRILTDPTVVNLFNAVETAFLHDRMMYPIPENVQDLYLQHQLQKMQDDPYYDPQEPKNIDSFSRTDWLVVLPEAQYATRYTEESAFYVDAGASRQSIREIVQLKYRNINPHITHLQKMGVVEDDMFALTALNDAELIAGDFGINPMSMVMGDDVHEYILSAYQREIMYRIMQQIGAAPLSLKFRAAFVAELTSRGLSAEQAWQRFDDIETALATELRITSDPTSQTYNFANQMDFTIELIDFYFNAQLTGEGDAFFAQSLFQVDGSGFLDNVMRTAIGDRYFTLFNASISAPATSDEYRMQQKAHVQSLFDSAVHAGIPATQMSIFMLQREDGGDALRLKPMKKMQQLDGPLIQRTPVETSL